MAIEQANVIDAIGLDHETGEAVLTLLDALDWANVPKHARLLQSKLEAYLTFVESGELFESYPDARGRTIRIDAIFRRPPPDDAIALLRRATDVAAGLSVTLKWRVQP